MAEYIDRYDMWVTLVRMPLCVKGFCRKVKGENCAVINADLSEEAILAVIKHEAEHFRHGDLESDLPVGIIEDGVRGI